MTLTLSPPTNSYHFVMANHSIHAVKSEDHISKDVDSAMDVETPSSDQVQPGISIRNGPMAMEVDEPQTNGNANGKRKSRGSLPNGKTYKDASSSSEEDDKPLVRVHLHFLITKANSPIE